MKCPACSHCDDRVLDSRLIEEGNTVRRRRQCLHCNYRFTTREEIGQPELKVRKRDGSYQPFAMAKVKRGVWRAIEKRKISSERCQQIIQDIEGLIFGAGRERKEISSEEIGAIVLEQLRCCDQIAYIRFISVYKQFDSIDQFLLEINQLKPYSPT